jgi:Secretion system C-terminal sorting domain
LVSTGDNAPEIIFPYPNKNIMITSYSHPTKIKSRFANLRIFVFIAFIFFSMDVSAQVMRFTDYHLESGIANSQGAVYRFTNVCSPANVDALVTVTELNNVTLVHIDGTYTGADIGFQPMLSSNSGQGDHYAKFTVVFVNAGTNSPANIFSFASTFFSLNGNNQINKYASTTIANSTWNYANSTPAIHVSQNGNLIRGKSANFDLGQPIDTANHSNSFIVKTGIVNSFILEFGFAQDASSWSGNEPFGALFKGVASVNTVPVKLASFNALVQGSKVQLKWGTLIEENFSHFVIERSTNGKDFTEIALVFSDGINKNYQYSDALPGNGIFYYRLRMVDLDQKSQNSLIRIVKTVDESAGVNIQAYPNPVVNELRVTIPASWQNKEVKYVLYTVDGTLVRHLMNKNANQTEQFMMTGLKPGMYILKVSSGEETTVKRIIKSL